jgi:toxin FitB
MILLDSNIIIYASLPEFNYLNYLIQDSRNHASIISKVEVLGYQKIKDNDKVLYEITFKTLQLLPINLEIIDKAVQLRQQKNLSLGDSIIAATALFFDAELYTRNVSDFKHIQGMKLHNPIT